MNPEIVYFITKKMQKNGPELDAPHRSGVLVVHLLDQRKLFKVERALFGVLRATDAGAREGRGGGGGGLRLCGGAAPFAPERRGRQGVRGGRGDGYLIHIAVRNLQKFQKSVFLSGKS